MDEREILDQLVESLYEGWDVIPTGGGFLVATDWRMPDDERIEIHIRRVGDREDLFLVTDGGELVNFLFAHGVDLSRDQESRRRLEGTAEKHSIKIADQQLVKGAAENEIASAVRSMLEAVKEASFLLWHKIRVQTGDSVH